MVDQFPSARLISIRLWPSKMPESSSQEGSTTDCVTETVAPDLGPSFQNATGHLEKFHAQAFDNAYRVGWDGENDPMSPRNMSTTRKWAMVLVVCTATVCLYVSDLVAHMKLLADTPFLFKVHVQVLYTQPPTIRSNRNLVHHH